MVLLGIYCLMEPIGISIGMIITLASGSTSPVWDAILTAIVSGTFIYIATMDILAEEFSHKRDRWAKATFCMLGFGMISALLALDSH